jgi:small subunit ribosomal protein S20
LDVVIFAVNGQIVFTVDVDLDLEEGLEIFDITVVGSEKLGDPVADPNALFHLLRGIIARRFLGTDYTDLLLLLFLEGDQMANHPSAIKRHRQSRRRRMTNQMNRHKLKTQLKKLRAAIATGKEGDAKTLLPATCGVIDRSVKNGVIKKNTARRYKSRLTKRINSLPAA